MPGVRLHRLLTAVSVSAVLAACGSTSAPRRSGHVPLTLGSLPPRAQTAPGPRLVLPSNTLAVADSHSLSDLVTFNVPLRNDGAAVLRIDRLYPG